MSRKFYTSVDLTGLELSNIRVQNLSADPTAFGKGHIYFNTTANELRWYSGTAWVPIADATDLAAAIAQEVTDRNAAVAAEASARSTAVTNEANTRAADDAATLITAKAYTDTREAAEITARNSAISTHNSTTTSVHGIADTSALALTATVNSGLALKSNIAGPTFTGTVTIPTLAVTTTATGITKAMVGLGNVDNTTDVGKPVSTAQQTALNLKANLASPALTGTPTSTTAAVDTNTTQVATTAFVIGQAYAKLASPALTGTPTAPTATAGTSTTQIATTAFVGTAVSNLVSAAPAALDTLNELATALGNDAAFSTTVTNSIATKVPLAGGTMTGLLTLSGAPTSNLHAATKAYADLMLPLAGGTMTGNILMGTNRIRTSYYATDLDDVMNKQAMNDAINGGVGYGIGVSQAYADGVGTAANSYTNTKIANEVLDRNVNIANAKNEAVGISQTYADGIVASEAATRLAADNTEVTNRNTAITNAINTEVTNRNSAISSAIATEVTDRNAAIAANSVTDKAYTDSSIATEVTNRNSAIATETSNRATAISSAIATEVTNRNTAIASEAALRTTADATTLTSANTYTDGKFTALTSSAVPEGTNLYYTQERVQDEINNTLVAGTNLTGSYNDTAGTYTLGLGTKVVITDSVQTLTNKTLTNPYVNDTVVVTATSTEINKLTGLTATTAELNKLAGATVTTTQLNYVTGVTSSIQTQLGSKSDTSHTHAYQTASNELTALAAITGTGFIKRTGTNTYSVDTNTYAATTSPTLNTSVISGTTSFNLINSIATTVNFAGAATTLGIGSNDSTSITTLNAPTVRGNLNYVDLYNTVATTVSFAGAATTLNIGGTPTGAVTHNYSANQTASGITKTINIGTGGAFGSITNINIGSLTSGATGVLDVSLPTSFNNTIAVPYPTQSNQAANKQYVDNIASGITIKNQVIYTTTENLNATYVNGTSDSTGGLGVGATLTSTINGALILDGVGVTVGQRILVKNQTTAKQNGIYVTTNPGDGDSPFILTRATDFNGNLLAGTIKPGNYIFVTSGTYLANSSWIIANSGTSTVTSGAIKVGTDNIDLAQYSGVPLNISTLGYVTIGTWAATPIAEPYISTAIARTASPTFTGHVHVPLTPVDNADATSKKYVDDLIFASLPYLPDIIPLDDLRYVFDDRESRFAPTFQGEKVALYNPLRLMISLNGVIQTPTYPEYVWRSMIPFDGFMLDSDGYIAFTQVPPAGSTFDGRVMLGPNVNTIGKAYPFRAMDVLLGD